MRIQLPLELWMAILDKIARHELADRVPLLWDSQLTPIVQHWLHEYRQKDILGAILALDVKQITQGSDGREDEEELIFCTGDKRIVQIAKVPMPGYVRNFEWIKISHLDTTVLAFLRLMQPLFRDVSLRITVRPPHDDEEHRLAQMRTALGHLLPMLTPLRMLEIESATLPFIYEQFTATLFSTKALYVNFYSADTANFSMLANWLFSSHSADPPHHHCCRMLVLYSGIRDYREFYRIIQWRSMDPGRRDPTPFIVRVDFEKRAGGEVSADQPVITNERTGEQLSVRKLGEHEGPAGAKLLVINCAIGVTEEWLAAREAEVLALACAQDVNKRIVSLFSTTIGPDLQQQPIDGI